MKRIALAAAVLLLAAIPVSAESVRVYVTSAAAAPRDGFIVPPSREITDSVRDLKKYFQSNGTRLAKTREKATLVVEVTSREERDEYYVVHVAATFGDHRFELSGRSVHQWKKAAADVAEQLHDWIKANKTQLSANAGE